MRFHVVGLPHVHTDGTFSACAYTNKVIGFCKMMKARGHDVFLSAGERNVAPCDEHLVCISEDERCALVGDRHYTAAPWDDGSRGWQIFNRNAVAKITERLQPRDFICLIGGVAQKSIADAFPGTMSVEFGVGYGGCFSAYRVFESYAWMHSMLARGNPVSADGTWWDAVIPGYLDPADFPFEAAPKDYYLYIGRLIDRKGYRTAIETCKRLGARLVVAGPLSNDCPVPPGDCEYVGVVGAEERGRLMSGAIATFVPTQYIEPFGNVAIESMACGTPVLTTDWGAFTETNIHGVTGFRCRTLGEFMKAAEDAKALDRAAIRRLCVERYSLDVIGAQYERYFNRLLHLWGDGWYTRAA